MKKIRKAFLIYPPTGVYMRDDRCQAPVQGMTAQPSRTPLDLIYMAATLEKEGIECSIKDYPLEAKGWSDFESDLKRDDPDMLVISVTTPTLAADLNAAKIAKKINKNILVVSKGAHYLTNEEKILHKFKDLDIVIRGESEFAVAEIATADSLDKVLGITYWENGAIRKNANRPLLEDLDKLPFPSRHLLNNSLYLTPDTKEPITLIYTGRGCPHNCIFCAVPQVSGNKIKLRSPEKIVDEIEECVKKYKIRNFFFRADTFTWNEEWVIDICKLIIERKLNIRWGTNSRVDTLSEKRLQWMKKSGCWIIGFGIESGNQESLDLMKKRVKVQDALNSVALCKKHGIKTYALFIIGLPWETRENIMDTARFTRKLNSDYIDINIAFPLPGTELFELAKGESLFNENEIHGHDYSHPFIKTRHLSTEELIKLRRDALVSFYLRPSYILKTLLSIRSGGVFLNYFKAGMSLIPKLFGNGIHVEEVREDL